jgi:2-phospho-L-lactate guanylyltransferase
MQRRADGGETDAVPEESERTSAVADLDSGADSATGADLEVVVPLDAERPKTRLSDVLDPDERRAFVLAACRDVLAAVRGAGLAPTVLATGPVDLDVPVEVDDRPLTPAVNGALARADGPVCVVMADLALATPAAIRRLTGTDGEVVLAPGRGGGTNAIVARHPDFRVDYHGASYRDHRRGARACGASVGVVDSMRLATDVDEPADLVETLLHGTGEAADWLRAAGFELDVDGGRVGLTRDRPGTDRPEET